MRNTLDRLLDVLANLGFVMRDTRRARLADSSREWGAELDGLALSIHPVEPTPTLSAALKNTTAVERRALLPAWLDFYSVSLIAPNGANAKMTPFGHRLLSVERSPVEMVLSPGALATTEIPLATIYDMRPAGEYRVSVSCRIPGSRNLMTSNELRILTKAI